MSHTEGKLEVVTDCPGACCWHIQKVGNTDKFHYITSLEMGEADARRLVACWNALSDVPTEDIENSVFIPPEVTYRELERQRDELVNALRSAKSHLDQIGVELASLGHEPDDFALPEIESVLAKYPEKP